MTTKVYEVRPQGFKATAEVAACYLEVDGKLLLLECSSSKAESGKWGVPAGKIEMGETPKEAAKRELFQITLTSKPEIHLSWEHSRYLWATVQQLETLPLMEGAFEALQKYQKGAK